MIVVPHGGGHAVIEQAEHARQCAELARALADPPSAVVVLAAEQHELGMVEWDRAPELDESSGLPRTVNRMRLEAHLPLRLEGPRRLAERDPYAGLLASLHHVSFYRKPPAYGLLRRPGRLIAAYLRESGRLQSALREQVDASDEEVERDWRVVRRLDGISHHLIHGRTDGFEPWPFASERVRAPISARLLEGGCADHGALLRALERAPRTELAYEAVRPSTSRRSSESDSPTG